MISPIECPVFEKNEKSKLLKQINKQKNPTRVEVSGSRFGVFSVQQEIKRMIIKR